MLKESDSFYIKKSVYNLYNYLITSYLIYAFIFKVIYIVIYIRVILFNII